MSYVSDGARALLLLGAASLAGLLHNALRRDGIHLGAWAPPVECTAETLVEEMAPAAVAAECQHGALIADTRPADRYAAGHIAGAVHLRCDATGQVAEASLLHLSDRPTIVVYGERTDDARRVAARLEHDLPPPAHARIVVLQGGFEAWSRAGLACASGPCNE